MSNNQNDQNDIKMNEIERSIQLGVTEDTLDMKMLVKWTMITVIIMFSLILIAMNLLSYHSQRIAEETAISTRYNNLMDLRSNNDKLLNSYGVVDAEKGVYHITIEKAIDAVANDYK